MGEVDEDDRREFAMAADGVEDRLLGRTDVGRVQAELSRYAHGLPFTHGVTADTLARIACPADGRRGRVRLTSFKTREAAWSTTPRWT